jgi:hypothetical protein
MIFHFCIYIKKGVVVVVVIDYLLIAIQMVR